MLLESMIINMRHASHDGDKKFNYLQQKIIFPRKSASAIIAANLIFIYGSQLLDQNVHHIQAVHEYLMQVSHHL